MMQQSPHPCLNWPGTLEAETVSYLLSPSYAKESVAGDSAKRHKLAMMIDLIALVSSTELERTPASMFKSPA